MLNGIDTSPFLFNKRIRVATSIAGSKELSYQPYQTDLLHDDSVTLGNSLPKITTAGNEEVREYVFSRTNGSLTSRDSDPSGIPVFIESMTCQSETRASLWDTSSFMKRILHNTRSSTLGSTPTDVENIRQARYYRDQGIKAFVFLNDETQIKQLSLEGFDYLRPDDLFVWMVKEGYITLQKAVWNFRKRKEHNSCWTTPGKSFREIWRGYSSSWQH